MDFCATLAVTVPVPAECSSRIDLGGVFTAQAEGATQRVEFTIVYSEHVNDVALGRERHAGVTLGAGKASP